MAGSDWRVKLAICIHRLRWVFTKLLGVGSRNSELTTLPSSCGIDVCRRP